MNVQQTSETRELAPAELDEVVGGNAFALVIMAAYLVDDYSNDGPVTRGNDFIEAAKQQLGNPA